ncbi:MAG: type II toxin-antitoxin system Phd/YefM family antitoxin [Candidatus Scalindua sp.]
MKNIGLFEAKTRLSEICEKVRKERQPVLITRRGKPLVRIDPIENTHNGVWDLARKFKKVHGPIKENPVTSLISLSQPQQKPMV